VTSRSKWTLTVILVSSLIGFVSSSVSQEIEVLKKGVVKVTAMAADGKRRVGTGFIVRLGVDAAYIVTASHVVEGAPTVDVEFFTGRNRPISAKVTGLEGADPQGLAALTVEGKIPAGLSVLKMNRQFSPTAGDPVTMIGFPAAGGPWAVTKGEIVGRKGRTITFSGAVDEGNSGGPLVRDGQVIGVVTEASSPFASAIPAVIAQYVLESWGVKSGELLRSKPAAVERNYVVQMIREKGFSHPGDLSKEGLSSGVIGNFQHEFEARSIGDDKVVIDHATGLMWQQAGTGDPVVADGIQGYVGELSKEKYAGFSDWRLPTVEELASLLEPIGENRGLFIHPLFDPNQDLCWTADKTQHVTWAVNFFVGTVTDQVDRSEATPHVRAVRSIQTKPGENAEALRVKPAGPRIGSLLNRTRIAFVSNRDENQEIYVMEADGSNLRRLTQNRAQDASPAWSPDGSQIAFTSDRDGNREIYVMKTDGSNVRRLTNYTDDDSDPAWSPDGSRITFVSLREHEYGIYELGLDGGNPVLVHSNRARLASPVWSPDGKRVAFVGYTSP